jgi:putative DNA methylase
VGRTIQQAPTRAPTAPQPTPSRRRPLQLPIRSSLRHLDAEQIGERARVESRNREVHLPPVSVYRWWARRTEAINGAIIDAYSVDHPGQLLVSDPFAGGGVIPIAAILRNHRVYAQDLNPWAAEGLSGMLGLPTAEAINEAAQKLHRLIEPTLADAYTTTFSDGSPAEIAHTFRVASARCSHCGERARLFPHALVSLKVRRERKVPDAFLACPAGHLFEGQEGVPTSCPTCDRRTDPAVDYTARRIVLCPHCGNADRLDARASEGDWSWEVVLVERSKGRQRELAIPTPSELARADHPRWKPTVILPGIPEGQETRVLRRHGLHHWHDLYPRRQRVVLERLLTFSSEATENEQVLHALRLAVIGSAEMAGHLSRWDRFYLKSYESMAGHRFNFSTFVAEPNVWGASASGRGTVRRRLERFGKIADWMHQRVGRTLQVEGPIVASRNRGQQLREGIDVRVVEGSSERILLPDESVDLTLTDPPYHDDVQYDELSLPLRSWAEQSVEHLADSASVNPSHAHNVGDDDYETLLARIFSEVRRTLRDGGHLIFSYANREPEAWAALLAALDAAGLRACGYLVVHSENETDVSKRGVRACTLDLILDLVANCDEELVEQWKPTAFLSTAEAAFLTIVGDAFLRVGSLARGWRRELVDDLKRADFLCDGAQATSVPQSPLQ